MTEMHECPWCGMQTALGGVCVWCKQAPPPAKHSQDANDLLVGESERSSNPILTSAYVVVLVGIVVFGVYMMRRPPSLPVASNSNPSRSVQRLPPTKIVPKDVRKLPPVTQGSNDIVPSKGLPTADSPPGELPDEATPSREDDRTESALPSSLPPDPDPKPVHQSAGSVRIGNAKISFENDGRGGETAVGRVLIINDGDYEITDFRLSLEAGGGSYALVPFEGNFAYPRPIIYRHIPPGGQLDVPVMTTGYYRSYSVYGVKFINVEASVDGPPGIVTSRGTIL